MANIQPAIATRSTFRQTAGAGFPLSPIVWQNLQNATADANGNLFATAANAQGFGNLKQVITGSGLQASMRFGHNQISDYPVMGLSDKPGPIELADLNFGFFIDGVNPWYVWTGGTYASNPSGTNTPDLIFGVDLYTEKVVFLVNEGEVHTLNSPPPAAAYWPTSRLFYGQTQLINGRFGGTNLVPR